MNNYRLLEMGEIIQIGDEFNFYPKQDGTWRKAWSIGNMVAYSDVGYFRRPITSNNTLVLTEAEKNILIRWFLRNGDASQCHVDLIRKLVR